MMNFRSPHVWCGWWLALLPALGSAVAKPEAVDLREVLRKGAETPAFATSTLSPEWIGIIRPDAGEPVYMRADHVGWRLEEGGKDRHLWIARMGEKSGYVANERAEFRATLPTTDEVKAARTVGQMRHWFGVQPGFTDGSSDGERIYSSESWICFTQSADGNLRWLQAFAHTVAKEGETGNPDLVRIEKLEISEGTLHPADPNSEEERRLYKTADQIAAEEEKEKAAKRAILPEPLRALVTARETPGDGDLLVYTKALNEIRRNPDPLLFRQIAALKGLGTGQSYLENILIDGFLKADSWTEESRNLALHETVDSLAEAPDPSELQSQAMLLLRAMRGGHLKVTSPKIDLAVTLEGQGYSSSQSAWEVTDKNRAEAAGAMAAWFRKRLK